MDPTIRLPERLLDEEEYKHLSPTDKAMYLEKCIEKILDLNHRYVSFFPPADHPYDVLLDNFEPGMRTADVKRIFEILRPQQIELIKAIGKRPQVDDAFLHLDYDEQKQWNFGVQVISAFGYDWQRGRLDKSAHPFTTSFSSDDVRITTRFEKNSGVSALFSTLHEAGHGLYDQGITAAVARTPLAYGASLPFTNPSRVCGKISLAAHALFGSISFPKCRRASLPNWAMLLLTSSTRASIGSGRR